MSKVTQHNVNVGVEDGIKGVVKALKGRMGEIISVLFMLIFPLFDLPSSICITLDFLKMQRLCKSREHSLLVGEPLPEVISTSETHPTQSDAAACGV